MDEFGSKPAVMEDPKEQREFRSVWVDQVKGMLKYNNESHVVKASSIPRVAKPLLNAKPEAYLPEVVSLGPYHHWSLDKHMDHHWRLKMSTAEAWKVMYAATFSSVISFAGVVEKIKKMEAQIASFYDWEIPKKGDYSTNFALMMAVDSSFLLKILFGLLDKELKDAAGSSSSDHIEFINGRSSSDTIDLSHLQVAINRDILKLENQIPLTVLKEVFEIVIRAQPSVQVKLQNYFAKPINLGEVPYCGQEQLQYFRILLWVAYKEMSPFEKFSLVKFALSDRANDHRNVAAEVTGPHLLGYIHEIVSSFLKTGGRDLKHGRLQELSSWLDNNVLVKLCGIFFCFVEVPSDEDLPISGYSAGQLARAGVKFKSFSHEANNIQFDESTDTLYLPRVTIKSATETEVFFRNLVAFEFNNSARGSSVIDYVELMDCLIDTPDDVRVLMESRIICRQSLMLTHERIATMWDGMCRPFSTGHSEPPGEIKMAINKAVRKKHYKVKIKMRLIDSWDYYYGKYFSSPWKFVALVVALLLLAANCISAYCTLFECNAAIQGQRDQTLLKTF